jgi:hypothetical protein
MLIPQLSLAETPPFRFTRFYASMLKDSLLLVCTAIILSAGCTTPNAQDQLWVSKPNMQFSRSAIYTYTSKITPQLQPGLALTGGAQHSSCTLCR